MTTPLGCLTVVLLRARHLRREHEEHFPIYDVELSDLNALGGLHPPIIETSVDS